MGSRGSHTAEVGSLPRPRMVDSAAPATGGGGKKGLNPRIGFAIAAGAIGSSFQHGYNTGVLNAPEVMIKQWTKSYVCPDAANETLEILPGDEHSVNNACNVSVTFIWSFVVSIFCIGGMMGGSVVGVVSSRLGRKGGLAPMYLAEISPTSLRGALGTVYQLIITMSILLSQVLGMGSLLGTPDGWPWLLAITAVPAIFQIATLPFCPESPKYLLLDKDDEHGAEEALQWLRGTIEVHDEMDEMKQEQESMKLVPKVTLKEMLVNSSLRKPLIIAMMMMLAQQLSGINCAIFYSTNIFKEAGLNPTQSQSATLGMGAMNVAMTFVSLALIEKAGRKVLMLSGLSLMICMTILLLASLLTFTTVPAMSYVAVVAVITFVVGFATGPGSIPWFFVTELFAQSGRPTATSIAVVVNWTANFLVGLGFQPMQLLMGPWVFMVFIVIQLFFIVYVAVVVPETKGKTIDEITARFRK